MCPSNQIEKMSTQRNQMERKSRGFAHHVERDVPQVCSFVQDLDHEGLLVGGQALEHESLLEID